MNFYAYMVEVEVDPETGAVTPLEIVAVIDTGTIINPIAHQGQVDGGFIYGWGQAVTEELIHDNGTMTTLSLAEYKLPTMADVPPFRTIRLDPDPGPAPSAPRPPARSPTPPLAAPSPTRSTMPRVSAFWRVQLRQRGRWQR